MIILPSTKGFPKSKSWTAPSTWDVTYQTFAPNQVARFTAPHYGATGVNITINWGDGVTTNYTTTGDMTHTYTSLGTYLIKLNVSFASAGSIRFNAFGQNNDYYSVINTSALPYIPGLGNTLALAFLFGSCRGLTSVPEDLFRYNPQLNLGAFSYTFYDGGITSVPANLFRYNVGSIGDNLLYATFQYSALTSIPVDFLKYNTNTKALPSAFANCNSLKNIDPDLIRYMTGFVGTAGASSSLYDTFYRTPLDTSSYSNFLISIDTYRSDLGSSCTLFANYSQYNSSASAARANLVARGWNITDAGLA